MPRRDGVDDRSQLLEQLGLDLEPPGGVQQDDVGVDPAGFFGRPPRDLDRERPPGSEGRQRQAAGQDLDLLHGGRAPHVSRDQQGTMPFAAYVKGQLGSRGGLARPLQAGQHHHRGRCRGVGQGRTLRTEQDDELVVDYLHQLLAGRQALHDLGADGSLPDAGDEVAGDLVVHVRLE